MVTTDKAAYHTKIGNRAKNLRPDDGVTPDLAHLLISQPALLGEHVIVNADHADVVQLRGEPYHFDVLIAPPELSGE
jgi:hypothetical protein